MPSRKFKKNLLHWSTIGLWVGILAFAAVVVAPLYYGNYQRKVELALGEDTLLRYLNRADMLPTAGRVQQLDGFKLLVTDEFEECRAFCLARNAQLERNVLGGLTVDATQFAINYKKLKDRLARMAKHEKFLERYSWEKRGGQPQRKDFPLIERKAAITEVLVTRICRDPSTGAQSLAIGAPEEPEELPPIATGGDLPGLRHQIFPVKIVLRTRLAVLSSTLKVLTDTHGEGPCTIVRSLSLKSIARQKPGHVEVTVNLDVLHFEPSGEDE